MEVSSELLFFFSALGAFNGFLLGLYFSFIKKPKHISNFFLGGLLICLSIRIGKSVIFYFNHDLAYGYLQFGLTACLFIGPFLFFYLRSIYSNDEKILRNWYLNLAVIIPILLFVNFKYPFEHHIEMWRPHIINGIYIVWLVYSVLAFPYLLKMLKSSFAQDNKISSQGVWDLSIYIGNILIWAAFFFCGFTSYILGSLLFSFMFYLLIMLLVFRKKDDFSVEREKEKYKNKKIDAPKAQVILDNLKAHIVESNRFTNPNLKLADVAKSLNLLPHTLSQVLNDNLGKSFPQFLNEYRIEEAKRLLVENKDLTLEAIGYDCGFNSKSTFYSSFKKFTGQTPSSYQKQQNIGQ